jgi:hypothetical protein
MATEFETFLKHEGAFSHMKENNQEMIEIAEQMLENSPDNNFEDGQECGTMIRAIMADDSLMTDEKLEDISEITIG